MTPEQIQQDNELIAVFDGWEIIPGNENHKCFSCDEGKGPSMFCTCDQKKTRYRKESTTNDRSPYYNLRWEVLMPVVEKIEAFGLRFEICENCADIMSKGVEDDNYPWLQEFDHVYGQPSGSKREAVYKTIVDFIKWYNEQNKQP